ncbi:MAG: type IV pilus secretin PilQ [Gammaproteobacteria bacterium]|nr:type IV pilus secretin PilQ [Gammaproteobacteria bacterium]MCW8972541.1 type IV pilus secretin PilQ [Gammaproteobacteria bacterium]MCW8993153.1 type IV pilus secretin PilQ [Gammaproteobacteria bacterium]
MFPLTAHAVEMESIEYSMLSSKNVQIMLTLSEPVPTPKSFTIDNPARLVLDFAGTSLNLEEKNIYVDVGAVKNIRAVEGGGRSRVVVNLIKVVPHEIRTQNNQVFISLKEESAASVRSGAASVAEAEIKDLDFSRSVDGGAAVKVRLSHENASISINEKADKLVVDFYNFKLPEELSRRLDVTDFATPARFVDFYNTSSGARLAISAVGNYEHLAYQAGDEYTVELKPLTEQEAEEAKKDELGYSGEKLSLNFQNIEVRAVLQLLADFTGLNIVASDTVTGSITLRLKNVPWDQAMDIVLKTRGLGMRQTGNVILVAPNAELAAREKQELEAKKQMVDLAPLRTAFYNINYAKASDIATLLKAEKNSILSDRGSVTIDTRTNTLMVLETAEKHAEVAKLIDQLDVPIKQVMIESRIVIANDDFSKDIGVRFGSTYVGDNGSDGVVATTGSVEGTDTITGSAIDNINSTGSAYPVDVPDLGSRYNVNLPAANAPSIALGILGGDYLVDLELSALQTEGRGEVISNPRVVTSNQTEAVIEQGVEIPYQEASSSGATSVSFKKAVLSLAVTPQITPDDRVHMDLEVNKDSVGGIYSGIPSIDTRSVTTQVLVDNGDTVVLGGIYETSSSEGVSKVPLLGDIPLLGYLFRSKSNKENKAELLVFVTPKILKEGLAAAVE